MAIKLNLNYQKKAGLPNYGSHCFSVGIETEVANLMELPTVVQQHYGELQRNVDQQIQHAGLIPDSKTELQNSRVVTDSNGYSKAPAYTQVPTTSESWNCSEKQANLLNKLIGEAKLSIQDVNSIAMERFGKPVPALNKLEASGLIDELIDKYGKRSSSKQPYSRKGYAGRAS